MKIGKLERVLNKWQFGIEILKSVPWKRGFFPYFKIWCFKLLSFPPEGMMLQKFNYKGLFWTYDLFDHFVITMQCRTFKVHRVFRKLIPYQYYKICYPIKIKKY